MNLWNILQKNGTKYMNQQIFTFTQGDYPVPLPIEKLTNDPKVMVPFGSENLFPNEVKEIIESTSLLSTILDKTSKYVFGNGVDAEYADQVVDDNGTTFNELVYDSIYDFLGYGAFAIQVRKNPYNKIKKLDHLRIERVRTNEDNSKVFYHSKWGKYTKPNLTYEAYKEGSTEKDTILYYKDNNRHVYGFASWWSSLADAKVLQSLTDYNIHQVENAFLGSCVISLCEGKPSEEEVKGVEADINRKFAGTKNAGKILVTFSDSPETTPKITAFNPTDLNSCYLSLQATSIDNLFSAFCLDPILIGRHPDTGIFSETAYKEAFDLYNATTIKPIQQKIKKAFSKLGYNFEFKPFTIEWSTDNKINEE